VSQESWVNIGPCECSKNPHARKARRAQKRPWMPIQFLITMAAGFGMDHKSTEDRVFDSVAELFSVLSTPIRLKIISAVCQGEKNVSELLGEIDTTQPNMSQHLSMLYRSGVLSKRREGTQMYYRLQSERVATLCRAVCTQVAIELDADNKTEPADRLVPAMHR
jgi:DNA-binding transcriptional ArsR family regulator